MSSFFEIEYCGQIKHIEVVDKIPQSGGTLPSVISFDGVGCKQYSFSSNCEWDMTSTSPNITVTPSTGAANVLYDISVCYTGDNKITAKDNSGNTYTIECDETGVLNWREYEYQKTSISGNYINIAEAVIGDCVEELGDYCFDNTTLTSVTLPDSLKIIGIRALGRNLRLTSITIPSGVTTIKNVALYFSSGLQSITVLATTPPTLGTYAFNGTNNCPIYVPAASVNAYKAATNWSEYADRITAIPNS